MPISYSESLALISAGVYVPNTGVWVQLVSNNTGTAYVSDSFTDSKGVFTFTTKPPGDSYTVNTGPTNSGPWTLFKSNWNVPVVQGETPAFQSTTELSSGPYTPATAIVAGEQVSALNPYNCKAYGTRGDGVTDDTTALASWQTAITASATGGDAIMPPGSYVGSFTVAAQHAVRIQAWGAVLLPKANTTGMQITQANGQSEIHCTVEGLFVNGASLAGVTGVLVQDTDFATLRDCRVANCVTGISIVSNLTGRWAEAGNYDGCYIFSCTTGINFNVISGQGSFGENEFRAVGISNCTTGVNVQSTSASMYRTFWRNVVIWIPTNGTGISLRGNWQNAYVAIAFENRNGTQTGITGATFNTGTTNVNTATFIFSFTGVFANQVTDPGGTNPIWRIGVKQFFGVAASAATGYEMWLQGDTNPRAQVQAVFAGGGGMSFGSGGGALDVNVYKKAVRTLATDGAFARSTQVVALNGGTVTIDCTAGEVIKATLSASTTLAAPTNPTDGCVLVFRIFHDATANVYTITWNAVFKRAGGAFPNTNVASATDTISFQYVSDLAVWEEIGRAINIS